MFSLTPLETSLIKAKKVCEVAANKMKDAAIKLSTHHFDCTGNCCDPRTDLKKE